MALWLVHVAVMAAAASSMRVNRTMHLPFSWVTLPRYTFCGNETKNYTGYPLRDSAVEYISSQGGPINLIGDHSSYRYPAEQHIAEQSKVRPLTGDPSRRCPIVTNYPDSHRQ